MEEIWQNNFWLFDVGHDFCKPLGMRSTLGFALSTVSWHDFGPPSGMQSTLGFAVGVISPLGLQNIMFLHQIAAINNC